MEKINKLPQFGSIIVVRGIPGSGKTTFAKKLCSAWSAKLIELDSFRQPNSSLPYIFVPKGLDNFKAARWCELEAYRWLRQGFNVVFSSTLTKNSYIQDFLKNVEVDAPKAVIRCEGEWENVHSVPIQVIEDMRKSIQNNFFVGEIILKREDLLNPETIIQKLIK